MELLSKLQNIQKQYGYLPQAELKALAEECGKPLAEVIGTASFYSFFSFTEGQDPSRIEKLHPCRRAGKLLTPSRVPWTGLEKARSAPERIIPLIEGTGLCGRGGSGFPTAVKWKTVRDAVSDIKYVVCNIDEGEPGTGKDRVLVECNPNAIIEGMAICAAAVGAQQGYIYLRGEYADLADSLLSAIGTAPLKQFEIELCLGSGAYVCGEETALLNSLEGLRGEPRLKPPFPGNSGLWGKPTVINNAETFAAAAYIAEHGCDSGTRLFTASGPVKAPGVYELPSYAVVAEVLAVAGGGIAPLTAVQLGGGSGEIVPYAEYTERSAAVGTGALRFFGADENLLAAVRELTEFYSGESCGVCTPCRVGLQQAAKLLRRFETGNTWPEDAEKLRALAEQIRETARCGLGQAAVVPILSLLNHFPEVLK